MSGQLIPTRASVAVLTVGSCLALLAACGGGDKASEETPAAVKTSSPVGGDATAFSLTSEAFADGAAIPSRYSCDGQNVSPALSWSGVPQGTDAFALIVDDPDAPGGTFTHWLLYNLPGDATELPEGVAETEELDEGGRQGLNDAGGTGYGGPCPPAGAPHRYRFTLYALDGPIGLGPGASKEELLSAIEGDVLAEAELVGAYGR